jgi:isopenicillin N synthase-like dioxygenase
LTGKAAKETFNAVPKIDFRRIYSDKLEDRKELAKEVGAACRDIGFFYAVNHGVDEAMLEDTFGALREYFSLPTDVKMETHNQKTTKFRGYEAFLEGKLDPSTRGGPYHHHPLPHHTNFPQTSKKASSWAKTPPTRSKTAP